MTNARLLPAGPSDGDPWDQALYAFLIEKGNRSGSRRTVEGYGRMLWPFFADLGKTPDRVTPADVLGWAHGIGKSGRAPSGHHHRGPHRLPQLVLSLLHPDGARDRQ